MQQKALDKGVSRQLHGLELIAFFPIAKGKTDPSISHIDNAVV